MGIPRRTFLATGARALAGGLIVAIGPGALLGRRLSLLPGRAAADDAPPGYQPELHAWSMVVDTTKCIGCGRCVAACKQENDVPLDPHLNRTWVERYVVTRDGEVYVDSPDAGINGFADPILNEKYADLDIEKSFFVPKLCNQCEKPPCVQVCPVAATYKTADGVVLVNRDKCIGCRYCIQACPYGARFLLPAKGVVDKCTWCYHRISRGMAPACVAACPVGARIFGDLNDDAGPVTRILRERRVTVLKPELGTRPNVRYLGIDEEVV